MAQWLFNSKGKPVAFIKYENVFNRRGKFIGKLKNNEIWYGKYRGEIVKAERLMYKTGKGYISKSLPSLPGKASVPSIPSSRSAISRPSGFKDVDY